jgi:cation transport ATPase
VTMIRDESIQNEAKTSLSTGIVISEQPSALGAMQTLQVEEPSAFTARTRPNNIAFFTIAGILLHLFLRYLLHSPRIAWQVPLIVVLIICGVPLLTSLAQKLFAREFGSDHLAGISIITSVILGEYLVAAIVVLMLSGGTALEQFASRRASSVLDALAKRMPQVAHRKCGPELLDVRLEDITVGDTLVVFPHEICPVDGVVIESHGKMNEAYLTGEPFEIAKTPGSEVLSGSINGDAALHIRAEKLAVDSRYARIMQVMQDAEQRRPRIRRLGDKLGAWHTPLALSLAGIAWAATGESHRFLAVLVVATPCPLLISIPVAVIGAISLAARRGIIIKNPAALEQINRCRTLIFDKTGTLTYGKPSLSEILCVPGFTKDEVLQVTASLEHYSKHPLSRAILEAAQTANLPAHNSCTNAPEQWLFAQQ